MDYTVKSMAIIGNPNEFLVKSLKNTLESKQYETHMLWYDIDALNNLAGKITGLIFFIESASSARNFLNFAKDFMADRSLYGILIGEEVELAEALKYLPGCKVVACSRPVDISEVLKTIERLHSEQVKESAQKRILVIDDDATFLQSIKQKLSNCYKVFVANSGGSALMLLAKHDVDLILLDIEMPVMSGTQVMEMLKSEPKLSSIPVIYLTGRNDARTVTDALSTKPLYYLTKQQSLDELYATIGAYFEKSEIPTLYNTIKT